MYSYVIATNCLSPIGALSINLYDKKVAIHTVATTHTLTVLTHLRYSR